MRLQAITIDSRVVEGAPARVTIPDSESVPEPAAGQKLVVPEEALREGWALPAAYAGTLTSAYPWPWPGETPGV